MPKYVHIAAHLSPDELEQRYRKADNPVERSHLQMIWLLACGKNVKEVAEVTGYCANWIRQVGMRAMRLSYRRVSIFCFSRPIRRNCNPVNDCGHSPTKPLPIVALSHLTSCKRRKPRAVSPFRMIRSVCVSTHSSIGGLPHAQKSRTV